MSNAVGLGAVWIVGSGAGCKSDSLNKVLRLSRVTGILSPASVVRKLMKDYGYSHAVFELLTSLPLGRHAWYRIALDRAGVTLMLVSASVVFLLGLVQPVLPRPFGGLLIFMGLIVLWLWALRHATAVMIEQAGFETPLDLLVRPDIRQGLWHFLLLGVMAVIWHSLPALLALPLVLPLFLLAPLPIILMARGSSLVDALDPLAWRELALWLGRDRLSVMVITLLVFVGLYWLVTSLIAGWPPALRNALVMALWVYLLLAWYALLGQICQQRSKPADTEDSPALSSPCSIDEQWRELERNGGYLPDHRRLADALELANDPVRLRRHGQQFLVALMEGFDRPAEAVERADRLLRLDPDFALERPSEQWALIQAAHRHGYPELVKRLCHNFLKAFPAAPRRVHVQRLLRTLAQTARTAD